MKPYNPLRTIIWVPYLSVKITVCNAVTAPRALYIKRASTSFALSAFSFICLLISSGLHLSSHQISALFAFSSAFSSISALFDPYKLNDFTYDKSKEHSLSPILRASLLPHSLPIVSITYSSCYHSNLPVLLLSSYHHNGPTMLLTHRALYMQSVQLYHRRLVMSSIAFRIGQSTVATQPS